MGIHLGSPFLIQRWVGYDPNILKQEIEDSPSTLIERPTLDFKETFLGPEEKLALLASIDLHLETEEPIVFQSLF